MSALSYTPLTQPLMRIIPMFLLLLSFQSLKSQPTLTPDKNAPPPPPFPHRAHFGGGLTGGSLNFHQNGGVGLNFRYDYNLLQGKHSSLSLGLGATIGTEDENGLFFPVEVGIFIAAGIANYSGPNLDLSFNHQVVVYSDFPLMLHYNWGLGSSTHSTANAHNWGFFLGGGFTETFTGYTSPTTKQSAQTNFWAWVADAGIRIPNGDRGAAEFGIGIEQPLRNPIGPILQPVMYKLSIIFIRL
jgi:hypothetical protein